MIRNIFLLRKYYTIVHPVLHSFKGYFSKDYWKISVIGGEIISGATAGAETAAAKWLAAKRPLRIGRR